MRTKKTHGGLVRARGMTEHQITVWLLSNPAYSQVNHAMEQMSGVCYDENKQHKEVSNSRTRCSDGHAIHSSILDIANSKTTVVIAEDDDFLTECLFMSN